MSKARIAGLILTAWMMAAAATAQTPAPYPSSGPADWAAVKAHADKAYTVAGAQWRASADYFCQPGARANKITDAPVHPTKIFDNVYVLGDVGTVVYAVTTPDGIVLIDSSYPTNTEKLLLPQMAQLGLDPAKVTHVLITHGHADHYGGAGYFQSKSGAKVVLSPADWDMVAAAKPGPGTPPPRRDVEIQDLKPVMAGGLAFTPVLVPGHTPGSLGWIFPVRDGGKAHMAALFGSTILTTERLTVDTLTQELASWEKFATTAKAMKVDVELQNHALFDNMPAKLDAAAARQPGQPNPFVVGASSYARFTGTIIECLKADIARKGGKA
jgi:metallo-beta-lactamase class B